jgi:probable HAF family extracellular repeat protein
MGSIKNADSDFEVGDMARPGKKLVALASATLVLVAGVPGRAPAAAVGTADRTLRLIRLNSGGAQGVVVDSNARGQILGYLADAGPIRPVLWRRDGTPVAIGVPGGYPHGLNDRGDVLVETSLWSNGRVTPVAHPSRTVSVSDVNNRRQVVGSLTTDFPQHTRTAFRWQNGQFIELHGPEGKNTAAAAVNDRGDVLGGVSEPFGPTVDIFVWRDGAMSLLGLSGEQGNAEDINDRGQVIGNRYGDSGTHPFIWQRGTMTDLMADRPNLNGSAADINNAGDVVGRMDSRPALWRHGRTVLIGPAGWTGGAQAINEHGDVAGGFAFNRVENEFDSRVFLWRDGRLLLSEPVIHPLRAGLVGMDERGRIAGYLSNSETGESRPVVWTVR